MEVSVLYSIKKNICFFFSDTKYVETGFVKIKEYTHKEENK